MKIQRFVTVSVISFFIIIGVLSGSFYNIERVVTLRYLVSTLNQSIFNLEGNIQKMLNQNRYDNIQTLLDESSAIDNAIDVYSISFDAKTIAISSSRALTGTLIDDGYRPVAELENGLLNQRHLRYQTDIPYFSGAEEGKARLLVELNQEFVFGRLNQIAVIFAITLFVVLAVFALGAFMAVRRWIILPLEEITLFSRNQQESNGTYFIEEISSLKQTLTDSFHSMQIQQSHLTEALEESRYLDGILRTVADINQFLLTAKNVDDLLGRSCGRLALHPGYELCHITTIEREHLVVRAYSEDPSGYLYTGMKISLREGTVDDTDPSVIAVKEKRTVTIDHLEYIDSLGAWHFMAEKGAYGSIIAIPLISRMDTPPVGAITIYRKESDGFGVKETVMLEELAGDIGFAYESFLQREQLRYHLTTDSVTDLPNRFSLVEALEQTDVCALAIINIDRFSDINEVYGIGIGDAILSGYGHWLSRKIAVLEEHVSLYKMGSDEYGLIFNNCLDMSKCVSFLEGLVTATQKESFMIEDIEIVLTITIGISPASERTLEHATAALKQAKRNRHSLEVFTFTSKAEQENNIAWYKRIKEAVEESRIVPYFQPMVDNKTGQIIKYEALIRLIERDGTVISPYLFLEIAKKTKLYPELTKMMVEKVVEKFQLHHVPVSLNLSTQDLINPELADFLEQTIQNNKMGRYIIFEILESEGIGNYTEVSAFVERFKAIGCRFAIDDFGSGYSNFDHLLKLNIDTLKIDGTLIKNLPHDRNAQIFVKHISDFAHEMGITTVAEFVASEEIYAKVCELGIDASQGYYFYEPSSSLVGE